MRNKSQNELSCDILFDFGMISSVLSDELITYIEPESYNHHIIKFYHQQIQYH